MNRMDSYLTNEDLVWLYLAHGAQVEEFMPEIDLSVCSASKFIFLSSIRPFKKKEKYALTCGIIRRGELAGLKQLDEASLMIDKPGLLLTAIETRNLEVVVWLLNKKVQCNGAMAHARLYGGAKITKLLMDRGIKIDQHYCVPNSIKEYREFSAIGINGLTYKNTIWQNTNYKELAIIYRKKLDCYSVINDIISSGRSDAYRILRRDEPSGNLLYFASQANSLKFFKQFWTKMKDRSFSQHFAKFGNIRALNFLHKHNAVRSNIYYYAAKRGHRNVIEWGLQKGIPIKDEELFLSAGCWHSLRMAKFCYEVVGYRPFNCWSISSELSIAKWMIEKNLTTVDCLARRAANLGYLNILVWLSSKYELIWKEMQHYGRHYDYIVRYCLMKLGNVNKSNSAL